MRYTIHELLRQYGKSKLEEIGELVSIQAKHAQYFLEFMIDRKQDIKTGRQYEAVHLIESNYQNIRLAWHYFVDHHQWELLPPFLLSFRFYWDINALGQDAIALLEPVAKNLRVLPPSDTSKLGLGQILAWYCWALLEVGSFERSIATGEEALSILQEYESPEEVMATYMHLMYPTIWLQKKDLALRFAREGLDSCSLNWRFLLGGSFIATLL